MDAPDLTVRRAALKTQLGQALTPEELRRLAIRQGLEDENSRPAGGAGMASLAAARSVPASAMTPQGIDVRAYAGSMWAPAGSAMAPRELPGARSLPPADIAARRVDSAMDLPDPAEVGAAWRAGRSIPSATIRPTFSPAADVARARLAAPRVGEIEPDPRSVGRLLRGGRLDPEVSGINLETARARAGLLENELASAPEQAAYMTAQRRHLELQNDRLATPETPFAPSVSLMTDPATGEPISALLTSPRSAVPISKPAPRKAKTDDVKQIKIGSRNLFYHSESKRFFDEAGQPVNFPSGRAGDIDAMLNGAGGNVADAGGSPAGARPPFVEGNFYKDANGNRAKYLGGGKWEEAR